MSQDSDDTRPSGPSNLGPEATDYDGKDPLVGREIGKYKIIDRVAKGGTATVYKAIDQVLKREVAFKVLHQHLESRSEVVERFRHEAQTVASLRHPNILNVYDFFNQEGRSVLVAEFMPGYTLSHLIKKFHRLPQDVVLMLAAEMLQGLREAHARGITHRDIKPANILLHGDLGVKISDFGLAKLVNSDDGLTKEGVFIGTPSFSSPEQIEGKPLDHRTDIFSLGLCLYMMATGRHAFKQKGDSTTTVWFKIVRGEFEGIRQIDSNLSHDLERILDRALQVPVESRYASTEDMLRDVLTALKKRGIVNYQDELRAYLRKPHSAPQGRRGSHRNKLLKLGIAAGISALVVGGALVFWELHQRDQVAVVDEPTPVVTARDLDEPADDPALVEPAPPEEELAQVDDEAIEEQEESPPPPPLPLGAKDLPSLWVQDVSELIYVAGDEDFALRFEWSGEENEFRLIDENRGRSIHSGRYADQIFDWDTWTAGDFSWSVAGQRGELSIQSLEDYRSRHQVTKRDLPVSSNFAEVDLQINPWAQQLRLTWESGPGAESYRVEIAADPNFQDIIFSGVLNTRYVQVDRLWERDQSVFWRVQYLDSARNVFFIDPVRRLNLQLNVRSPHVDFLAPQPYQRIEDEVFVRAVAPANSEIRCGSFDQADDEWLSLSERQGFLEARLPISDFRLVCETTSGEVRRLFILPLRP